MVATTSPSRRTFLTASLAAGGGLLVGFQVLPKPARAAAASTAFSPNAFVRIGADGKVTVVLPKTEMGQGVYTAIPMMLAEELEVDLATVTIEIPPGEPGRFGKLGQETGGSTSVRETWEPVRNAGAAARMMLIAAAAQKWGVAVESCSAQAGQVVHGTSGRKAAYGTLVAAAALLPVPAKPQLKDAATYRLIGKPTRRLDASAKVNGSAVYGIDVKMPGLKIATLAASPVPGGKLRAVNEAAALAVPGVRQVVRLPDAVAVVADHTWAAKQGLAAADPQWDDGANANLNQAGIVAELLAASQREGAEAGKQGDVETAMRGAARKVEAVYEQPYLAHATMEPTNCTVHVRADSCEVWLGSQVPDTAKGAAAKAAGLPPEKVTIHNFLMGGGFGRRLEVDMVERAIAIGKSVNGPVKVIWSREEDIQHDLFRPYYVDRIAAGLDPAGQPVAWTHRIAGSSIMARLYPKYYKGVDADAVESAVTTPYRLPNNLVQFVRQESPVTTSWWRGVGPLRSVFVVESFIDELAAAAKADPVAYRLGLAQDDRAKAVLSLAAEKAGWAQPPKPGRSRGVSLLHAWDTYMAQVMEIEIDPDGLPVVRRVTVALDCGQVINPDGVRAQVEGGVIFGISGALHGEITFANGRVEQSNFHDYRVLRMSEAPQIETHIIQSTAAPGGMGEPPTAGAGPALANAVFAATGVRVRKLPIAKALKTKT
ncbi:MAG: xanthine dehydrogenase family protein molybdopterin-binding subunit [Pseudomonadota bacterium]|uniref:xanthine dehydrogenase family protein molybdopterin-binding subunit n=1 Tax=Phenylobacterium sp. TaxID=1871053 RepID=UPI0025D6CF98|nr:xanthine dehydrogenase family protein molybdopterin-binding subunit [Phenylobacterium sp.]MBT9470100.1 xanthine dehydrogenase family protein molybdopterin-binding subunit [Phenylobacterium sp.]